MKLDNNIHAGVIIDPFPKPLSSVGGRSYSSRKVGVTPFINNLIGSAFAISATQDIFLERYLDTSVSISIEERVVQKLSFSQARINAFRTLEKHNRSWKEYLLNESRHYYSFSYPD